MGGIKNKLSKLTSRVKTLFNNAANNLGSSARGAVERSETEGLTIPLSDYRLTSPFSQRGTKSSLPLAKGRQMSVAHRWGRYTKYLSIACLSLAILSTLILNIVSSYSSSKIESNAEPATQANGPLVSGPATISLSITPLTTPTSSPCDTSNSDICMKIPDDGGIATGGHTVEVSSNSYAGYNVLLSASESNNDETSLVNTTNGSGGGSNSYSIPTTTGNLTTPSKLANNTWGYVLTNPTGQETNAIWAGLQPSTHKTAIATTNSLSNQTDNYSVYYGVKVDNPSELLAGDYQTQVVYMATVKLPSKPTITSITPSTYELGSGQSNVVRIAGANLSSAYDIYLQSQSDPAKKYNCTNIQAASDGNSLTCILPTDAPLGTYDLYVTAQGGTGSLAGAFSYTESLPDGMDRVSDDYGADGHVAVDYDENMIPVVYDETAKTWRVVTNAELQQNPKNWYDYTKKQWANALTVSRSSLQSFRDKQTGVDSDPLIQTNNNPDILGYWVYIPRYAYEVMRPNAVDKYVTEQNFDIVFETAKDVKKTPAPTCSTGLNNLDYRNDCGYDRTYPGSDSDKASGATTWATHPAFTWQYTSEINGLAKSVERNGFWIGKFETTGTEDSPTVKPNQLANIEYDGIGMFYSRAKSIGVTDRHNVGEADFSWSSTRPQENGHNLLSTTSHMIKNDEWGATAYLSVSDFGVGAGNVRRNAATNGSSRNNYDADGDKTASDFAGITGCGPAQRPPQTPPYISTYDDGTTLNKSTIESSTACSKDVSRAYDGSLGVLASTTGNIYGVYDMAGSRDEYVVAAITKTTQQSDEIPHVESADGFSTMPVEPYVNIFKHSDGFTADYASSSNMNYCRWKTCGGQALIEVAAVQSVRSYSGNEQGRADMWGQSSTNMPFDWNGIAWTMRGGSVYDIGTSGIFAVSGGSGITYYAGGVALRIVLLPAEDDAI